LLKDKKSFLKTFIQQIICVILHRLTKKNTVKHKITRLLAFSLILTLSFCKVSFANNGHEQPTTAPHAAPAPIQQQPTHTTPTTAPEAHGTAPIATPHATEAHAPAAHGSGHAEKPYNDMVMEHIGDANDFHVFGDFHLPLPCILYAKDKGLDVFMSSAFEHGHKAVNGYVMADGVVRRLPANANIEHIDSIGAVKTTAGEEVKAAYAHGTPYILEKASTLLGVTSWFDFSITKNVFTMLLSALTLLLTFTAVANGYKKNVGKAPSGIQSFFEPFFTFLRDEVVKPSIGKNWEKYFPFICSLFFFILINNLFGLIPFFPGGSNVTGNVAVTLALSLFTFFMVNLNGNKDYWKHIFWMPGLPTPLKPVLAVIEFAGVFIKPFTLFIRLFANITAGHIIILSLIGLIFMFGKNGASVLGATGGSMVAVPFVFAMNFLELFVAFLQAFIFALLTSLYIGSAVEEHHH
jgi:F-type H+-transporting ATPase subunit a